MNAFAVYCSGSLGEGPQSGKTPSGRNHNVSRRPALIGALPLYFLLRAGNQLRAALPTLHAPVTHQSGHTEVMHPPSVAESLQQASETAVKELAEREMEVAMLRERCETLVSALTYADERANAILGGRSESELAKTASRFEMGMTAAKCRAVKAERESEMLAAQVKELEREIACYYSDSVKTNAAIAAVTVALISLWVRNFAFDFLAIS